MTSKPTVKELRAWAGDKVSPRGRLPWALILAWNKAHPDRPYQKVTPGLRPPGSELHRESTRRGGQRHADLVRRDP